jgi:uncharacterized membrane protein
MKLNENGIITREQLGVEYSSHLTTLYFAAMVLVSRDKFYIIVFFICSYETGQEEGKREGTRTKTPNN